MGYQQGEHQKGMSENDISATLEYDQFLAVDAWCCSNCGAHTYDLHKFEIPIFCCRCGQKFGQYDYNGRL